MTETNRDLAAEVDTSGWKISLIAIIGIVSAALSGYTLFTAFNLGGANYYLYFVITLFLFLNAFVIQTLFVKYFQFQILIIAAELLVFSAFFYGITWRMLSASSLALFFTGAALVTFGAYTGRDSLKNNLKIQFWNFSSKSLRSASNGIIIFIVLFYIGFNGTSGAPLSEETIKVAIGFSDPLIRTYIPGISLNVTAGEFLREAALSGLGADERQRLETLPETTRDGFITNAVKNLTSAISKYTDISNVNLDDPLHLAIYKFIAEKFSSASPTIQLIIVASSGLFLFGILRFSIWPLTILVMFSSYLVYQILLALGFARIELETRSKEIVLIP